MIPLIFLNFLRFITDAAIYYSFAGFFALKAGGGNILPGLLIPAACYGFSRFFSAKPGEVNHSLSSDSVSSSVLVFERDMASHSNSVCDRHRQEIFRELCLLPCFFCLFFPALAGADRIAALPPIIYAGLLIYRQDYTLSAYRQHDIFDFFVKAYPGFVILCILFGDLQELASGSLPAAVSALIICVYLLRILRHDPDIYLKSGFLLRSIIPLLALGLLAGFLSIPAVLKAMETILYTLYSVTAVPLLLGISYLLGWIILHTLYPLLRWLAAMTNQEGGAAALNSAADFLEDTVQPENSLDPTAQTILKIIGISLLLLMVLFLLFLLYRKLTASSYPGESSFRDSSTGIRQQRSAAESSAQESFLPLAFLPASDPVFQIRKAYRSYLKLCRKNGFLPPACYTSSEICQEADHVFHDPDKNRLAAELRELYIQARYQGTATTAQARRARELIAALKTK